MISPQSSTNNYGLQIINRHNVITSHKSCNKNPVHENSVNDHSFKLIIMNCQSIVGKKSVLDNLIYQFKPDTIVGTESWLKPTISTNEFFLHLLRFLEEIDQTVMGVSFWHVAKISVGKAYRSSHLVMLK